MCAVQNGDVPPIADFSKGVAVIAFKAVVTLVLKRKENEDKVIFLLVKIQDLMETLVQ